MSDPKKTGVKPLTEIKKVFLSKLGLIKLGSILYPLKKISHGKLTGQQHKRSRRTKIGRLLAELCVSNAEIDFITAMISCWRSASVSKLEFAGTRSNQFQLYQFINQNLSIWQN